MAPPPPAAFALGASNSNDDDGDDDDSNAEQEQEEEEGRRRRRRGRSKPLHQQDVEEDEQDPISSVRRSGRPDGEATVRQRRRRRTQVQQQVDGTARDAERGTGEGGGGGTLTDAAAEAVAAETVHLVVTSAPLLSGGLRQCALALPQTDFAGCDDGGAVAVRALARYYTSAGREPSLVIPTGDFKSPLASVLSRFKFGVNVMVYGGELKWKVWTLPPYVLLPGRLFNAAVYDAQDPNFPALLSNVVSRPGTASRWMPYLKTVHFDQDTHLAAIYISKDYLDNTDSQIESARNALHYVRKRNLANGCDPEQRSFGDGSAGGSHSHETVVEVPITSHAAFGDTPFSQFYRGRENLSGTDATEASAAQMMIPPKIHRPSECYLPIVVFEDMNKTKLEEFVEYFRTVHRKVQHPVDGVDGVVDLETETSLRPHVIVDLFGHLLTTTGDGDDREKPYAIQPLDGGAGENGDGHHPTWIVSYTASENSYHQVRIDVAANRTHVENVDVVYRESMSSLPDAVSSSDEYRSDLDNVNQYAKEAYETSLVEEAGVATSAMPPSSGPSNADSDDIRCYAGECEIGNLFADAVRWMENSDVGIVPSFLFRGPGWSAGEIRYLELLENIPYTQQRCAGTMTGLSLLRLVRFSLSKSTFDPGATIQEGGRLIQVSGMKVSYNKDLADEKVLSVDVYDRDLGRYLPLNRTRLYTFASETHFCFTYSEFPQYMTDRLVLPGELPSEKRSALDVVDDVKLYLMREFAATNSTYRPRLEGRLVDDPSRTNILKWEEPEDCVRGETYWSTTFDCFECPSYGGLAFSKTRTELEGQSFGREILVDHVSLTNGETFPVRVTPDALLLPSNIELTIEGQKFKAPSSQNQSYELHPGEHLHISIAFDPSERIAGTDTSSVAFDIFAFNRFRGCPEHKMKYSVIAELSLTIDMNYLGDVTAFGYTSSALVILTSISFAAWVWRNRKSRIVKAMQPVFLLELALGVLLIGAALIPLSIDDGVASERGCDVACMALPWLLSLGLTVSVSALFSKLRRVNMIVNNAQRLRRTTVLEKDVILPTVILLAMIVIFMLTWTLVEPLRWERFEEEGEPWNTYGACAFGEGNVGRAMLGMVISLAAISFAMTCWQAFKARNIGSEFSEAKHVGIAVYSWVQLCVVGIPVVFLVDDYNVVAKYSVVVGLLFAVCMSMLLVVFVPMLMEKHASRPASTVNVSYGSSSPPAGSGSASGDFSAALSESFRNLSGSFRNLSGSFRTFDGSTSLNLPPSPDRTDPNAFTASAGGSPLSTSGCNGQSHQHQQEQQQHLDIIPEASKVCDSEVHHAIKISNASLSRGTDRGSEHEDGNTSINPDPDPARDSKTEDKCSSGFCKENTDEESGDEVR